MLEYIIPCLALVVACAVYVRINWPAWSRRWRMQDEPLVDRRPYMEKCKRLRTDGPTPCFCCEGECWGDQFERAMGVRGGGIRGG